MRISAVRTGVVVFAVCVGIVLASGAAAPPAPSKPNMTDQQHLKCCHDAGDHIVKALAAADSAEFSVRSHRFGLNPTQNEYAADVLLVGVTTITTNSGRTIKQIWAVYCEDSKVVGVKNLSLGHIQN